LQNIPDTRNVTFGQISSRWIYFFFF